MKKSKPKKLPLSLCLVQGAIGKNFVIKHFKYGIVKTKFPSMGDITPSTFQLSNRSLFKQAVASAKEIYRDPAKKEAWQKKLGIKKRLFNALIKLCLDNIKISRQKAVSSIEGLVQKLFQPNKPAGYAHNTLSVSVQYSRKPTYKKSPSPPLIFNWRRKEVDWRNSFTGTNRL